MREVAQDVWQIPLLPRDGINAYLVGDVLVDAGIKELTKTLLGALEGRKVRALALTHAHPDHGGGAGRVLDARHVPYWVGAKDAEAAYTGEPPLAEGFLVQRFGPFLASFDGRQVDRDLIEGDELAAGFTVLETPGHSPGHLTFWRESDRTAICGDVLNGMGLLTTRPGLRLPPKPFTPDPAENRRSAARLASLDPDLLLFGHGPPLMGAGPKLRAFLAQ